MLRRMQHRDYKRALTLRLSGSGSGAAIPPGGKAQKAIMQALFVLMGRLAKIDGRVSHEEVECASSIMNLLELTPRQRQEAIDYFEFGKLLDTDSLLFVSELVSFIGQKNELAYLFLKVQLRLVHLKGCMRLKEKMLLRDAAELLGFEKAEFLQLCAEFSGGESSFCDSRRGSKSNLLTHAYDTLQIKPNASDGEIRPAYLRLMTRYHPDKLMSENLSEEALRMAQEKAAAIRTAYEEICGFRKLRV